MKKFFLRVLTMNGWLYRRIAGYNISKKRNLQALKYLLKAYEFKEDMSTIRKIGVCYYEQKLYKESLSFLKKYSTKNSNDSEIIKMITECVSETTYKFTNPLPKMNFKPFSDDNNNFLYKPRPESSSNKTWDRSQL